MTLPTKVIDRLFDRLALSYGSEFKNKWSNVDANTIKSHWAHELSTFKDDLSVIGWALENLPDRCPNVIEFKKLCRQAPRPDMPMLEAQKASADVVDPEIMKMMQTVATSLQADSNRDYKAWAKRLKERHDKGEKLGLHQIRSYKFALGITDVY